MAKLTPAEILRIYGVDVTTLPLGSVYQIATTYDMWLSASGAPTITVGDLIIASPANYTSRIYAHKVLSRPFMGMPEIGATNQYIYIYHRIYAMGAIRDVIDNVFKLWAEQKISFGRMSFVFDYNKEQVFMIVDYNTVDADDHPLVAVKTVGDVVSLNLKKLDDILAIYGNTQVVQTYKCDDNGMIYYAYVGMEEYGK